MESNNSLNFLRRSVTTTGQIPTPRQEGLAIPVGDNIYYYAGRAEGNVRLGEIAGSVFHVFNTKSASWSKIETTPPRKNCGDIFIYGTAVGTDIWINDHGGWLCFDTVKQQWRKVDLPGATDLWGSLHLSSIGVIGQSLYYYDGDLNSFEKKVYQVNTSTSQISASAQEGFGEHPQERHEMYMLALSDDILVLYAPFASYEKEKAAKHGELFYYDLKETKWARVKELKNNPSLNLYAYTYVGRIGSSLYFSPTRDTDPNEWWVLDLATATWKKKIVEGDKPKEFANYATVVGDKIYCWMSDGKMSVIDVNNMPSQDQQRQIDEHLAQVARAALSHIKAPVTVIDEYVPEPIVIDTSLESVNASGLKIHREMVKDFSGLFPLMDQQKIIESTVAAPSDSVFVHKNYIHYLTLAWSNHFSVILSPDIIFYTVLCEIADEILTSPDAFRHLFTDSTAKKQIMAMTHDVSKIDLNALIQGIAKNLPVDASIFTADFSCSTAESRLAMQSAFCEAMSAYYYYMSTMCGIPRVKVLGTRQDWETLEHKIHRMRTEVFNQDGSADQKMSLYLKNAEEQTRKIYTTRDPEYWKEMFSINNCMSGHTDVVEGWVNAFYRKGYARKENGKVRFYGDDFYNYKAHISTVKWQNVVTQRHFELKSGLLYSNVVHGESQEDKKFPWLEPQFGHVIVETDGAGKMSPEAFKRYIENTLKGRDKMLMQQFYEVLKDDPIELVKGGPNEINFRLELVTRLVDSWKQEYLKSGQGASNCDFSAKNIDSALDFYSKIGKSSQAAFAALTEKIVEYLKLNKDITQVHIHNKLATIEHEILDLLIGNPKIEELTVFLTTQESIEKMSQLLLHPSCNLKCFEIGRTSTVYSRDDDEDDELASTKKGNKTELNYSAFVAALLNTKAPLEALTFDTIKNEDVAKAVAELCRRPNGLKHFKEMSFGGEDLAITEILIRGQIESKTLKEISLKDLGNKEIIQDGRRTWVDVESEGLKELIINNMPLNPSLETVQYVRFRMYPAELAKALSIPSLKTLGSVNLQDLSFLDVTTKLESINSYLTCTAEQMGSLQKFVMREDCPLKTLFVEKSTLHPGAAVVLGKGLVHNRSIKTFNLRKSTLNTEDAKAFTELIVEWLEKPYCPLQLLNLSEMTNVVFEGNTLQRLLTAIKTNKTLQEILVSIKCSTEDAPLFVDLVQHNSTLHLSSFGGSSASQLSGEARDQLIAAANTNETLVYFMVPLLLREDCKYPRIAWDSDEFFD